ncbi:MAG: hypothetical protein GY749_31435 [Desulfobacteraceae bacterium]|nr:hypothetical protein [Desulfobacteraceae bacterium]
MIFVLEERIGDPSLFCGRKQEMKLLLNWADRIPRKLAKSRALLGRRKSGKTAVMQRLFNILWNRNSNVVPFYFEVHDQNTWLLHFSDDYIRTFLSQYLSFLNRTQIAQNNEPWEWVTLEDMARDAGNDNILRRIGTFRNYFEKENEHQAMNVAFGSPSWFAGYDSRFFLVMIDEIQYMTEYIYKDRDETVQAVNLPGAFHGLVELKSAPMLVSGSYVGWMTQMIEHMFVGGRLKRTPVSSRLSFEEGMEAVYKYAEHYQIEITEDVALSVNIMTRSDPYYIASLFGSEWQGRDFSGIRGAAMTFANEITDRNSELHRTWLEYIRMSLEKVNDRYGKQILLILSRERDRELGRDEILNELGWSPDDEPLLEKKLSALEYGNLITRGSTDYHYRGISDDILYLIFHDRYLYEIYRKKINVKDEILTKAEKLEKDNRVLKGQLAELKGRMLELTVWRELNRCRKNRNPVKNFRKRLRPFPDNFDPEDAEKKITGCETMRFDLVWMNYLLNIPGAAPSELDVLATGCNEETSMALVFETKNRNEKNPPTIDEAKFFLNKLKLLKDSLEKPHTVCGVYLSAKGFSGDVETWLHEQGIFTADMETWTQE